MRLRYKSGLWLNVRSAAAINRCFPLMRRLRRGAWLALALGFLSPFVGQATIGVYLIFFAAFFFGISWVGALAQGFACSWGASAENKVQEITISPEGLLIDGSPLTMSFGWEAISEVIPLRRFIVLLIGPWSGLAIPRKRLDDISGEMLLEQLRGREGWPALTDDAPGEKPWSEIGDEVHLRFAPNAAMIASASRAITWRSWVGPFTVLVLGSVWAYGGLHPLVGAIQSPTADNLAAGAVSSAWAILFLAIIFGGPHLQARRAMKSPVMHGRDQEIGISSQGVRTRGPLHDVSLSWNSVRRAAETDDFFLLFFSRAAAIYIPRSALSESETDRLRAVLSDNT